MLGKQIELIKYHSVRPLTQAESLSQNVGLCSSWKLGHRLTVKAMNIKNINGLNKLIPPSRGFDKLLR